MTHQGQNLQDQQPTCKYGKKEERKKKFLIMTMSYYVCSN